MTETSAYPLVDIGANLAHDSFSDDLGEVIAAAKTAGLLHIMVTGASVEDSRKALELALAHPGLLCATAGVHPHNAKDFSAEGLAQLRQLALQEPVKAVGETGLDYFRDFSPRPQQQEAYAAQLELAAELKLPVFLHQRDAHDSFLGILREYRPRLAKGVVHCFTGNEQELRDYLELDMHIGITGWICDERRGQHLHDLVRLIPPERLLLETDAPYLLPRTIRPRPASRRNAPANLVEVLAAVSRCLGQPPAQVAALTTRNAKDFFNL